MKKGTFTRAIVALTIIALLLPCFPVIAAAETPTYATYTPDSSWYGNGTATEFFISTPEQLAYFMQIGTEGTDTFNGKVIKLTNDIIWNDGVATADGFTPSAAQGNVIYKWSPFAQNLAAWKEFRGTVDGQGHSISGLYISATAGKVGFIGQGRGAKLQNLSLVNAYVTTTAGSDIAIGIGSCLGDTVLTNVHTSGHVIANKAVNDGVAMFTQAGNLIGGARYKSATFTLTNCTASGSVLGYQMVGGLIGGTFGDTLTDKSLTMTDCINYATVTGYTLVGGLVGNVATAATFTRCASFGAVSNTNGAAGSGSLVAIRANNGGASGFTAPTADSGCAEVIFTDCFVAPNASSSHAFPVFVYTTQCGHRIITRYSDYENGTANCADVAVYPGSNVVTEGGSAFGVAGKIKEAFNAYEEGAGTLAVPAKGTDAVKIEGVQTKKAETTFAARFIASINLEGLTDVKGMGFEVAILNDLGLNGAAAVKKQASTHAYTSILSNYGMETVTAQDFDADYLSTLVIDGIPASGIQTLLVRSYYTTGAGAVYYSGYVAFSFINGEYAGSTVVSTVATDSVEVTEANAFVDYNTTTYDLAALLPDQVADLSISNDTETFEGTLVPLSFGVNTFTAKYTENGNPRTRVISISRRESHRVVFNSNGGSYIPVHYVADGATIDYKTVNPTRSGCKFTGWYTLEGTRVYLGSYPIKQDTVLVAHWEAPASSTAPQLDASNQPAQLIYTTSSAALNINWKDYANAFLSRPNAVYCTLTNVDTTQTYLVKVTETGASFEGNAPEGASISQGAGNWTVKITGLAADSNYTLEQKSLGQTPYTSFQTGTTVVNTYTKSYDPMKDDTAALYTANGRLYDIAGNVVVLTGVVTVNVGTVNFAGNTSVASLSRLKAEGVNCIRVTMQIEGTGNIGYALQTDGTTLQTEARKQELIALLQTAVDNASAMGMYCIIDWGVLGIDPQKYQSEAEEFFGRMAEANKDNPYVIYEICNEPKVTNGTWHTTVKVYSEKVIDVIRAAGSQGVVIVGTNDYSKRISDHTVVENGKTDDPIDYPILAHNVAYGYHAYAYNHEYTNTTSYTNGFGWRLKEAIEAGLTVIVTEFSPAISNIDAQSTGGMQASTFEANKYLNVFQENDVSFFLFRYISHFSTYETSSQHMFIRGNNASLDAGTWTWDQLTECGQWFLTNALRNKGFIRVADYTPSTPR